MSAPMISDHALLRFLERAGGFDPEPLRGALSAALARSHTAARAMGSEEHQVTVGNCRFVIKGDVVVTMLETHQAFQHRKGGSSGGK